MCLLQNIQIFEEHRRSNFTKASRDEEDEKKGKLDLITLIKSTFICTTQGCFMTLFANIIELMAECCVMGFMGISAVTFGAGIQEARMSFVVFDNFDIDVNTSFK